MTQCQEVGMITIATFVSLPILCYLKIQVMKVVFANEVDCEALFAADLVEKDEVCIGQGSWCHM